MKAWKHILVLAGALGLLAAFLPLIEVEHVVTVKGSKQRFTFAFTARELTFGMERTHKLIERELPRMVEARLPSSIKIGREDVRTVAEASRAAMLIYVPSVLILLIGLAGLWRGRVGRGSGAIAAVLGLITFVSWFALRYGIDYGLEEAAIERTKVTLMIGAELLIGVGILAIIGGLGAALRPEPERVRKKPPPGWQPHVPPPP